MTNKSLIFDGNPFAYESVALDLAVFPNKGVFLDLDKRSYLGAIIDPATIEVYEVLEDDIIT